MHKSLLGGSFPSSSAVLGITGLASHKFLDSIGKAHFNSIDIGQQLLPSTITASMKLAEISKSLLQAAAFPRMDLSSALAGSFAVQGPTGSVLGAVAALSKMERGALSNIFAAQGPTGGVLGAVAALSKMERGALSNIFAAQEPTGGVLGAFAAFGNMERGTLANILAAQVPTGGVLGAVAALRRTGYFDSALASAAVAVATFLRDDGYQSAEIEEARAQSFLVDAIADIDSSFAQTVPTTSEDVEERFSRILEKLISNLAERLAAAKKPIERISIINVAGIILSVLAILTAGYYGQLAERASIASSADARMVRDAIERTGQVQLETQRRTQDAFEQLLERLGSQEYTTESGQWIVRRTVRIMSGTSAKATKVAVMYPKQIVVTVREEHKWLQVEYYDYLTDSVRVGWVLKKYMRRVSVARPKSLQGAEPFVTTSPP